MPWRKPLLVGLATVAALLACATVAVHVLVDTDKLKRLVQDKVQAAWGRDLRVEGLSLDLLPWPAVHATGVALAAPPWSRSRHVLEVDQLDANLELVPLFVGRVRVKSLDLRGVKAALEEAEDGAENWRPGGTEASEGRHAPAGQPPLGIGELHLRDVLVHRRVKSVDAEPLRIDDATIQVGPGLRDVNVDASLRRHDQPVAVKAHFDDLSGLGQRGAVTSGRVELAFEKTHVEVQGRLPLERTLQGHDLRLAMKSPSLDDVFRFMGFDRQGGAPFSLAFASRGAEDGADIHDLALSLGDLRVSGQLHLAATKDSHRLTGQLSSSRIDWLQVLKDAGGKLKPPRHDDEIFHADPVAWHALAFLGEHDAQLDLAVESLRLANGLTFEKVKARAALGRGVVDLDPFSASMLGGKGGGALRFEPARQAIRARFEGQGLLLEQWFRERGSKIPFRGGPMDIKASLKLGGETYRELASSIDGPVAIRMGKGAWESPKAGEVEEMMVSALAAKGSRDLRFDCISAKLDFHRGRAQGRHVLGAKSDVSQLLTAGSIDFREEQVDLRGRVQARKGITVGIATVAGGVRISGKLAHPHIGMDPDEKPALLARAAAAVATAGASIVGEALLTSLAKDDPCEAVFR